MVFVRITEIDCLTPRPYTFNGLMELYEANYIRMRVLCGDRAGIPNLAIAKGDGAVALYLKLVERTRYTDTFSLTHYFKRSDGGYAASPNVDVRMYYDGQQAEVVGGIEKISGKGKFGSISATVVSLEYRWRANRFLLKWLDFCLAQGYQLSPVADHARPSFSCNTSKTQDLQRVTL